MPRIPVGFYFTIASLAGEAVLQVSQIHGYWWTVGFLAAFGTSLVVGFAEAGLRIWAWGKRTTEERDQLRDDSERIKGEAEASKREQERLQGELRQNQRDRQQLKEENERLRAEDAQDKALQAYLDQMERFLLDKDRPLRESQLGDDVRRLARVRTLATLEVLGPRQKRSVLRFLSEHGLIAKEQAIVRLNEADLSEANLSRMQMFEAHLDGVILRGADLSEATLSQVGWHSAGWDKAAERGGDWRDLVYVLAASDLSSADLSEAVLRRASLVGCNLIFSDFAGADLDEADLRGADLREARNLTQEQIDQAYGSSGGQEYMQDTFLPKGLTAPKAWEMLLSQQIKARGC